MKPVIEGLYHLMMQDYKAEAAVPYTEKKLTIVCMTTVILATYVVMKITDL